MVVWDSHDLVDISLFLIKLINKRAGFLRSNCGRSASRRPPASVFPGFEECRRTPVRLCHRYSLRGSGMRAAIKVTSVAAQQHATEYPRHLSQNHSAPPSYNNYNYRQDLFLWTLSNVWIWRAFSPNITFPWGKFCLVGGKFPVLLA